MFGRQRHSEENASRRLVRGRVSRSIFIEHLTNLLNAGVGRQQKVCTIVSFCERRRFIRPHDHLRDRGQPSNQGQKFGRFHVREWKAQHDHRRLSRLGTFRRGFCGQSDQRRAKSRRICHGRLDNCSPAIVCICDEDHLGFRHHCFTSFARSSRAARPRVSRRDRLRVSALDRAR